MLHTAAAGAASAGLRLESLCAEGVFLGAIRLVESPDSMAQVTHHCLSSLGTTSLPHHLFSCCYLPNAVSHQSHAHTHIRLGERLVGEPRVVATAVLFFVASPASIHHSMLYTEALFTTTSWLGLYCLYCWESSLGASLAFAASAAVRSNGEALTGRC